MDDTPKKQFVPHAGGKKKKKRKKKRRKKEEPEVDPHYVQSMANNAEQKPKTKWKRKTNFEVDDAAPTVRISGGNRNFGDRGYRKGGIGGIGGIGGGVGTRRPKGTRTQISNTSINNDMDMDELGKNEKEFRNKVYAPKVLEDKSGDEEEQKYDDLMDIDNDNKKKKKKKKKKNEENVDIESESDDNYDPWSNDGIHGMDDIQYTPITLKRKPNYGTNGIIEQSEMLKVFKEKEEYGNDFIFIQMPPLLPLVAHLNEDEKRDLANFKKVEQSLLKQMGEGEIGKIRIRKSGKTELVIGDYVMDINFSSPIDCYQEVMHIHCENATDGSGQIKGKSQFLGNVPPQNNLVCSYKAKDLVL